jgi:hypothetical protein
MLIVLLSASKSDAFKKKENLKFRSLKAPLGVWGFSFLHLFNHRLGHTCKTKPAIMK